VAFPSTPRVTAWPSALAASAWVTTEQESKLPAAADAGADGDRDEDAAAAGLAAGPLNDEAGAAGEDEDDDDELQAASEIAAPHTITAIATWLRRM
jgi:hypothetical protein